MENQENITLLNTSDLIGEGIKIAVLRALGEEVSFKEIPHECKCKKKELRDYTNDELLEEVKRRFDK